MVALAGARVPDYNGRMRHRGICLSLLTAVLLWSGGCTRLPNFTETPLNPATFGELQRYLLGRQPDLEVFRARGPFVVTRQDDQEIRLSATHTVNADMFFAGHAEKTPLVIYLHGYEATKGEHAYQAMHTASWGMHSLTLQLPNTGPWVNNGRMLAGLVNAIQRHPELVAHRADVDRIILVGHSFGATAVAVALAEQARAAGGILLDPAGIGRNLPKYLQQIRVPVLVLGADERVVTARYRDYFYRYVRRDIAEVSVTDATHEDAQFPADDAGATEALQITFASAITAGAFSIALTRRFDYAWASFQADLKNGKLFDGKKK